MPDQSKILLRLTDTGDPLARRWRAGEEPPTPRSQECRLKLALKILGRQLGFKVTIEEDKK
jgi:hypothetical protein